MTSPPEHSSSIGSFGLRSLCLRFSLEQSWEETRALLLKGGSPVGGASEARVEAGSLLVKSHVNGGSVGQSR